ncbi:hypothetical protein Rsub_07725 [Raphidocelis subcapitata]|uniref:Uncharacterized protein n=1 Tax=Raphidocelis subcapitata TaxID=307507 RepID=A0A2V0P5J1_9CHLO|nr:hypothetical protein Rsub_07725 [Raphidocelis subcapitata]|eukprot:GBF95141.1 hypothetical protein Rsub_07725 [Raphidocelis subcapitata]
MNSQGYDPSNFLLYDDSSLLALYCQAVAVVGVVAPLYLLMLQGALGGTQAVLTYGLRATGATSSFLMLVHFVCANAVVRLPRLPREKKPMAPVHAQHSLSLLFSTHQMHAAQALAMAWLYPQRLAQQPAPLTALMAASWVALLLLARVRGAVRLTATVKGAARAAAAQPAGAGGALARGCRYFLAGAFFATYAWHALESAARGRLLPHAAVGAVAFAGGWVHAAASWAKRRRLGGEGGGGAGAIERKND